MYQFNEGSLELPGEWYDRTIHVLTAADGADEGLSFTISREIVPWGMSFNEFVKREIKSLSKKLKNFRIIAHEEGQLSSRGTVTKEFSWDSTQGHIHQMMTLIDVRPVIIFTATMTGEMTGQQKEKIRAFESSFVLRAE